MSQTLAIFLDAYRELNARKLFWITLLLSLLFAGAIGAVVPTQEGMSIFGWDLPVPFFNLAVMGTAANFYKYIFISLGVHIWLTWIAAVLALVSTAQIFPDFISGGAIELTLSKPISRVRLFFTKYLTGLFFVALQVTAFSLASFLVIGIRGNTWEPGIFLAVPITVLFFSYLFCVCALLGLITKSTIAALLLTILFWFLVFIINTTDQNLLNFQTRFDVQTEQRTRALETANEQLEQRREQLEQANTAAQSEDAKPSDRERVEDLQRRIERGERYIASLEERRDEARDSAADISPWYKGVFAAKTALPKTQETIALLQRWIIDAANLDTSGFGPADRDEDSGEDAIALYGGRPPETARDARESEIQQEIQRRYNNRSPTWIIGTSLAFEAVILAIAAGYFYRKDF